jgi:hypothetical protein
MRATRIALLFLHRNVMQLLSFQGVEIKVIDSLA